MAERVFAMPDLGEGLEEAVVAAWLVAEGDEVELNQPIAEIETAKAVVEMPSPYAGRIARLHAAAGATVAVGSPLVTFEVEATTSAPDAADLEEPGRPRHLSRRSAPRRRVPRAHLPVRKLAKISASSGRDQGTGPRGRVTERRPTRRRPRGGVEGLVAATASEDLRVERAVVPSAK
jgi:pyruvate dehydrogenase E2 component (dihydrolipoamide acetyltransferase)